MSLLKKMKKLEMSTFGSKCITTPQHATEALNIRSLWFWNVLEAKNASFRASFIFAQLLATNLNKWKSDTEDNNTLYCTFLHVCWPNISPMA